MLDRGSYIADRYEILEKIGTGGMSDVYQAKDHTLNRFVAIKVLKSEFANDQNFVAKFVTEAQSAAGLTHPNIVNIYDVGNQNGLNYIVMEYIEGITLKTYIKKKGRLSYKEAVSIAIQVAKGIEDAHNHQVVHRDIKPQNIMISTDGTVKVTDFGIARAATADTIRSEVMGSVHYISPEQARNGFVDGKSDIYSLGIVMYEMITGRVPFDADTTVAIAVQHLQDEMVRPSAYVSDLPISVEKIILKCTQKSADRRYESMGDLIVDLRKAMTDPYEDFVVLADAGEAKTRMVGADEVDEIRNRTGYDEDTEETAEDEEEEDDEGFLSPKMEKAVTIMGIVAAIVIVGLMIFLVGSLFGVFGSGSSSGDSTEAEASIEVPNVTGMDYDEAQETLNDLGLGIQISSYEYSDEYDEGEVISQDPEEGEMVEENTTIYVVISNGEEDSTIPDVTGYTEDEAKEALDAAGINYGTSTYEYSSTVEAGVVISMSPDAGTTATSSTVVTLTVSRGTQTVSVPSVTGMTKKKAKSTLKSAGLTVGTITEKYSSTVEAGKVISQSVSAGSTVEEGTTVNLVISLGEETTYVTVPSVTGKSISSAQSTLSNYGLSCTYTEEYSDTVEAGVVISQSVSSGTSVESGTTITLVVSLGPKETTETDE